jgi:chemotaxis protein MotB
VGRRKKPEEHVNHERWLVSYADFITLLFAFFTSMYAISTVDAEKAGKMVFSTRAAFSMDFFPSDKPVLGQATAASADPVLPEQKLLQLPNLARKTSLGGRKREASPARVRELARELEKFIDRQSLNESVTVRMERRGLIVSLAAAALFAPGAKEMRRRSRPMVNTIAEMLLVTGHHLRVEGHTDSSRGSRSNWRLSVDRAVHVVAYLAEEFAFPADRVSVAAYSDQRPLTSDKTAVGRAMNRRVDFVLEYMPEPTDID